MQKTVKPIAISSHQIEDPPSPRLVATPPGVETLPQPVLERTDTCTQLPSNEPLICTMAHVDFSQLPEEIMTPAPSPDEQKHSLSEPAAAEGSLPDYCEEEKDEYKVKKAPGRRKRRASQAEGSKKKKKYSIAFEPLAGEDGPITVFPYILTQPVTFKKPTPSTSQIAKVVLVAYEDVTKRHASPTYATLVELNDEAKTRKFLAIPVEFCPDAFKDYSHRMSVELPSVSDSVEYISLEMVRALLVLYAEEHRRRGKKPKKYELPRAVALHVTELLEQFARHAGVLCTNVDDKTCRRWVNLFVSVADLFGTMYVLLNNTPWLDHQPIPDVDELRALITSAEEQSLDMLDDCQSVGLWTKNLYTTAENDDNGIMVHDDPINVLE